MICFKQSLADYALGFAAVRIQEMSIDAAKKSIIHRIFAANNPYIYRTFVLTYGKIHIRTFELAKFYLG